MISVGIDVSKGSSTVCILKVGGEVVVKPYQFMHTVEGLNALLEKLNSFDDEVRVIMEATGHYHLPVLCFLQEHKIFTSLINPMLMKKYANVRIRKCKTDKLDSLIIAQYGLAYWTTLKPYHLQEDSYYELRFLSRQYYQLLSLRIKEKVALGNLLDETMPGIERIVLANTLSFDRDKLVSFAYKYWHYDTILKMSEKKFIENYEKWTKKEGYQFKDEKARMIYTHAKNSITTLPSQIPSVKMTIQEIAKILLETGRSLNKILTRMQELAKALPEYNIVRAMPGVGDKLAPRLIAEIGDIRNYHSPKALVAFAGIDAPPYQSGVFNGTNRKISKRGSKYLRKTGYEIMKCLKTRVPTQDTAVYDFIIKKERQGKAKKQAKIAGLNKFLRIYYGRVSEVVANT